MFRRTCPREYIFAFQIVLVIFTTQTMGIAAQMPYGVCSPCQSSKEENVGEYQVPCNLCPSTDCVECCSSCRNNYARTETQLEYVVVPLLGEQNAYDFSNPVNNYGYNNVNPASESNQAQFKENNANLASNANSKIITKSTSLEMFPYSDNTEKTVLKKKESAKKTHPSTKRIQTSTAMEIVTELKAESSSKDKKAQMSTPMERASEEETDNGIVESASEKQVTQISTRSTLKEMNIYDDDDARRAGIDDDEFEVVRGLTPQKPTKSRKNLQRKHIVHTTRKSRYAKKPKQNPRHIKTSMATESPVLRATNTNKPIHTTQETYSYLAAEKETQRYMNNDHESPENRDRTAQVKSDSDDFVSLTLRKTMPLKDLYKETNRHFSEKRNQQEDEQAHKENRVMPKNNSAHKRITLIKSYRHTASYPEEQLRVRNNVSRKRSQSKLGKSPHYTESFLEEPRLKKHGDGRHFRALVDAERFVERIKARHLAPIK